MANIHDCLDRAVAGGAVQPGHAAAAKSEYDQLVARFEGEMPLAQAQAEAARILREVTRHNNVVTRHAKIAQLQAMVRLKGVIESAADPAKALKLLLEYDDGAITAGFRAESVRSLRDAIEKSLLGDIQAFLRATGTTLTGGSRDKAKLRNVVRELHGQATGDMSAKQLADAVRQAQERARQMFNLHGGHIGKIADYGVAHSHDARAIKRAGFDRWAAETFDRLAWNRIIDLQTGKAFTTTPGGRPNRQAGMAFLRRIYDEITSEGWMTREPSVSTGGRALYNQRAEHRILHFRDGDAWMDYNAQFGATDPFSAVVGQLRSMAQDIALMRVLGPNPKMGLEFASQVAMKRAMTGGSDAMQVAVKKAAGTARLMLGHLDGSVLRPAPGQEGWASFWSGTRGILTGTQLGSAILSSTTDLATIGAAARVAGLNPGNIAARATQLMASDNVRLQAANAGYIMDSIADMSKAAARQGLDEYMPEIAQRISTFTMRASFLNRWTDAWRVAIQMEFGSELGRHADRTLADLPEPLRTLMDRRGISAADWDQLRAIPFSPQPGTAFVVPQHFLQTTSLPRAEAEGLALRLQMLVEEQMEMMMPTYNLQARARWITQPGGTLAGEAQRIMLQYKNYPVAFTIGQIQRIRHADLKRFALRGINGRVTYTFAMLAAMTLLGGVAVQMKEMAKGRDPRPMTDGKFWSAAFMQGGGAGIFGDFLFSTTSRGGGSLAETLAGPTVGLAADAGNLAFGWVRARAEGDDYNAGRELANFVRYNTPVASSLWYARLAFDRAIADQLQRLLDPDAEQSFDRRTRQQERDYGNAYWSRPGGGLPQRAPALSNAVRIE